MVLVDTNVIIDVVTGDPRGPPLSLLKPKAVMIPGTPEVQV
jgi:predicted nucleic acid-binding protein